MPARPGHEPWTASCGRATRCSISATDRPTASSTPYRMSKTSTPASAARASSSSLRRNAASRRNPATSTSRTRRVDDDRAERGGREPGQQRPERTAARDHDAARATSEYTWVRPPAATAERGAAAAAADREAAAAAPAPTLAAPRASSSWLASIRRTPPRVGERPGGQHVVGVADHAARRAPAAAGRSQVAEVGQRRARAGRAGSRRPRRCRAAPGRTRRPRRWPAAPRAAGRAARGKRHWHDEQEGQHDARRSTAVARCISVRSRDERDAPRPRNAVAVDRDAGQLAQLADDHDDGDAGQVADQDRLGQQVGDEARAGRRRPPGTAGPTDDGQRGRERGVPGRVAGGQRRRPRRPSSARSSTPARPTAAATSRAARTPPAARRIAHSPATGGSPASAAYAITCGTRYAATVSPASTSPAQPGPLVPAQRRQPGQQPPRPPCHAHA